ncbi:MAG: metallophosphoesterase [Sporomusaceae bacterium]|nr:metallophosphoesterase [Sporomusaceae bacterium]
MMQIGVISDTHGDRHGIERAALLAGPVDVWLHAGDHCRDSRLLAALTGVPVIAVAGNCDRPGEARPDEFLQFAGCPVWLTHGHRCQVELGHAELLFWARQYGVRLVIYGHTHIPVIAWEQDVLIVNPGSAAYPRGGSAAGCGLVVIDEAGIEPRLIAF